MSLSVYQCEGPCLRRPAPRRPAPTRGIGPAGHWKRPPRLGRCAGARRHLPNRLSDPASVQAQTGAGLRSRRGRRVQTPPDGPTAPLARLRRAAAAIREGRPNVEGSGVRGYEVWRAARAVIQRCAVRRGPLAAHAGTQNGGTPRSARLGSDLPGRAGLVHLFGLQRVASCHQSSLHRHRKHRLLHDSRCSWQFYEAGLRRQRSPHHLPVDGLRFNISRDDTGGPASKYDGMQRCQCRPVFSIRACHGLRGVRIIHGHHRPAHTIRGRNVPPN